jgi:hypothetical protein
LVGTFLATATGFPAALAAGFAATLTTGLLTLAGTALTTGFVTGLEAGFAAAFGAGLTGPGFFATGFAGALVDGFAAGWLAGFAGTLALPLAAVALLFFPVVAFTSCLLAERSCAWSVGLAVPLWPLVGFFDGGSSARECTGLPTGKPISCKIETIIWPSIRK